MPPLKPEWLQTNRAHWDEAVGLHLAAGYDLTALRAGRGRLFPIEEAELGPVDGLRVLHLQCHFGKDTLTLAQRGAAEVVGLDFSEAAIDAARRLAAELGLADRARFVHSDLYTATESIAEGAAFDLVFVTWGALCWLPDIQAWARTVAHFLKPGGSLYLAEGHPFAYVFEDETPARGATLPAWFASYFESQPIVMDDPRDYADPDARHQHQRTYTWMHSLGTIISSLISAGLALNWLHEHDCIPWPMFSCLVRGDDGMYRWPQRRWLPLAFSLSAQRR